MKVYLAFIFTVLSSFSLFSQILDGHHINDFGCYGEKKLNKAPKKVYISSFKVFYQVYISDKHKHNSNQKAPQEYEATLVGVDTSEFQDITNDLYTYFVDSLTKKGYEIVPFDSVKNDKYFDGWVEHKGGEITQSHIEGYLLSRPSGYTHFEHKAFDHISFVDELPKLSKELGNIIVMDVEFVLPFFHTNTSKTGYDGSHISNAHIQFNITPLIGRHEAKATAQTRIHIAYGNPAGVAAITNMVYGLKHPVVLDGVVTSKTLEPKKESEQNPDYYYLVFTEDQINNVTHHVVCDPKAYKQASLNKIKEFSRFAFHKLFYFHELE